MRKAHRVETAERRFLIHGSDTQAYRQFRNSVAVSVIVHLAGAMRPWIDAAVTRADAGTDLAAVAAAARPPVLKPSATGRKAQVSGHPR